MQITARMPPELISRLDQASQRANKNRAELVRLAVEYYLDELEDLNLAIERMRDPSDPVLDWEVVREELLAQD